MILLAVILRRAFVFQNKETYQLFQKKIWLEINSMETEGDIFIVI